MDLCKFNLSSISLGIILKREIRININPIILRANH